MNKVFSNLLCCLNIFFLHKNIFTGKERKNILRNQIILHTRQKTKTESSSGPPVVNKHFKSHKGAAANVAWVTFTCEGPINPFMFTIRKKKTLSPFPLDNNYENKQNDMTVYNIIIAIKR